MFLGSFDEKPRSKLSPSFLLKSYFLKSPATVLMVTYFFMVFIVGYIVFALERSNGTCMQYQARVSTNQKTDNFRVELSLEFC